MLYVIFTKLEHGKIKKYEKIPFGEAVKLTAELESDMRSWREVIDGEFSVIDAENDNEALYEGTFKFGSYFAPNLYVHIWKNLPQIKKFGDKDKTRKQLDFMQKMDVETENQYKAEEKLDDQLSQNVDKTNISRLKKWQRRLIYALGALFAVAFVATLSFFIIQIASLSTEFSQMENDLTKQEKLNDYYADALLGNDDKLKTYLSEQQGNFNDQEQELFAMFLAEQEDYEKLIQLYDGDAKTVVNFLAKHDNIEQLKAFNEEYPTTEAKFELAYADGDYEKVLSFDDYDNTNERSSKKTYAYLKIGQLDKAKEELENNNDDEIEEKVMRYEDLNKQASDLDDQIKNDDEKEKKKHEKKKEKLKEEQENI